MSETLVSLWAAARQRLEAAGVETPVLDARLLLEAGAGVSRLDIVTDPRRAVSVEQTNATEALVRRREAREPMSHILGKKAFWTFELNVTPDVLTPRPETEVLVEAALERLAKDRPARVLDLGVGSGAVLIALLLERPNAVGVGVDASALALDVARANAERLGVGDRASFHQGNWMTAPAAPFDMVVSNPPYIPSLHIDALAPEVALFEPRLALDGGVDGLAAYRAIAEVLPTFTAPGGAFALEIGQGQAGAVAALLGAAGLETELPRRDLAGIERVVLGQRPAATGLQ